MSERRSARSYIVGRGNVPLPAARRWALERVESCEVNVAERLVELQAASEVLRSAQKAHAECMRRMTAAREQLESVRADLVYRMGDTDG